MIVLSCNNISKTYIVDIILNNISFGVNDGEKIGLVGLNGAGKSTLFKILSGEITKDSGDIYISKECKIGYLKQNTRIESTKTVFEEALEIFKPLIEMEKNLRLLEKQISIEGKKDNSATLQTLMDQYSELSEEFSSKNGYGFQSEIKGVLVGVGFNEEQFNQSINKLSGGQKTRVILAKLLLEKPDILLLDEPTNHLDIEAITWLEKYLKEYKGAAIVISHDRKFLDSTVTKIFHLENTELKTYNGNYTTYIKKRKIELELLKKKFQNQQKEIEKQKEIIKRLSLGGKRAIRQAQSRQKMLDKMVKIDKPGSTPNKTKIILEPKIKSGNDVLIVNNLKKVYDKNEIFDNVSFRIYKGDKVGLIGPNGIGKSTLFKIILNMTNYSDGKITIGRNVNIGYFDQEQFNLNYDKTIVDEIWDENPTFTHYDIRTLLAQFLFYGDDIFKEIGDLSGGEKSRLALLKLMLSKSNLLMMDEPTNHLDIDSKEVLEEALINYSGTLFVVSHDRYFLNKVANKILELSENGVNEYLGNYDYYVQKKNLLMKEDNTDEIQKTRTQIKAEKKKERQLLRQKQKKKKMIKKLEAEISIKENLLKELEKEMCMPNIYSDHEKSKSLHAKMKDTKILLDNLYNKWVELTD